MKWVLTLLASMSVTFLVLSGCRDDNPTGFPGYDFGLGVNVTNRGTPQVSVEYGWYEAGNATSLDVVRTSAPGTVVWGIETPGENGLVSPITHGIVPIGAVQTAALEDSLTPNIQYRATVRLLDGRSSVLDFTP